MSTTTLLPSLSFFHMATRDDLKALGETVRKLRTERGLSQIDYANAAGLDRSYVSSLENGSARSYPKRVTLEKLARPLRVDPDTIASRTPYLPTITPYDRDPEIRQLVDHIEALPRDDRDELVRHTLWTARRIRASSVSGAEITAASLADVFEFPSQTNGSGDFPPPPVRPSDWIEKDTDTPRDLHAWVRPVDAEAAAGVPRENEDVLLPSTQLINSLREIHDERVKVVKILGDSMHPVLRNGWKVLIDPSRALFQPGKIVMVYLRDEGTTIGVLAERDGGYVIVKRNRSYGGPVEIRLDTDGWFPIGTVTTIVEAPVEVE